MHQLQSVPAPSASPNRLQAFILAGGRGARLAGLTACRAKPAVAMAGTLRLLDFTLSNCLNSRITRISVLTQYAADSIARHLQGHWWRGPGEDTVVEVRPSAHPGGYRGTADAVHQQLARVRGDGIRRVLVLAGDHVCKMDLRRLLDDHRASGAALTVCAVAVPAAEAAGRLGVLQVGAGDRVTGFAEKPARPVAMPGHGGMVLASMGIYAAELDALERLLAADAADAGSGHDFGQDVLPRAAALGLLGVHRFDRSCVRGPAMPAYWRDAGSIDSYWQTHQELTGDAPQLDLFDPGWPLHTRPSRSLPSRFGPRGGAPGDIVDCLIGSGCRIDAAAIRASVLASGVQVGPGSALDGAVLLPGVVVGRGVQLRRVIVDEQCRVPDGLCIGHDAAADRARFHVSPDGITLVTGAMLAAASRNEPAATALAAGLGRRA